MIYLIKEKIGNYEYLHLSTTPKPDLFDRGISEVVVYTGEESWGIVEIIKLDAVWRGVYPGLVFGTISRGQLNYGYSLFEYERFLIMNFESPGVMEGINKTLRERPEYLNDFLLFLTRELSVKLYHSIYEF